MYFKGRVDTTFLELQVNNPVYVLVSSRRVSMILPPVHRGTASIFKEICLAFVAFSAGYRPWGDGSCLGSSGLTPSKGTAC